MNCLFFDCCSLFNLPDLSKWSTNNVENMNFLFSNCISLTYLPDLSKWKTNNLKTMNNIFEKCSSLSYFPNISKWNVNNVTSAKDIFKDCYSTIEYPDISKWKFIVQLNNNIDDNYNEISDLMKSDKEDSSIKSIISEKIDFYGRDKVYFNIMNENSFNIEENYEYYENFYN